MTTISHEATAVFKGKTIEGVRYLSAEEAGVRAAEAAGVVSRRPDPRPAGDGIETLLPGKVAKDELLEPEPAAEGPLAGLVSAFKRLFGG